MSAWTNWCRTRWKKNDTFIASILILDNHSSSGSIIVAGAGDSPIARAAFISRDP
jgi:hypothetical protein